MKFGVSSYSFSQTGLDTFQIIFKAKEMGFEAVEFAGFPNLPPGETALSFAPKVREFCQEQGLSIVSYTVWADFLRGSGGDLQAEIARVKGEVEVAQALGAPLIRHDATWGWPEDREGARSFQAALPLLIEGCRAVTEFAAERGIKTMVENHGFFCQDSERLEQLVCGVDHPNFGILLDVGNFLVVDEDPAQAVGRLLPYTFHVHVKDFHRKGGLEPDPGEGWFLSRGGNYLRGAILGHGVVSVVQILRLLKNGGYGGALALEFEGMEDPLKAVPIGLANLKRYLAAASGV